MAYIRSNDDYDRACGIDPVKRRADLRREIANYDVGVCNPRKVKELAELEEELATLERQKNG
jgi:hypothetical protein